MVNAKIATLSRKKGSQEGTVVEEEGGIQERNAANKDGSVKGQDRVKVDRGENRKTKALKTDGSHRERQEWGESVQRITSSTY